jgi:hypothetical protein
MRGRFRCLACDVQKTGKCGTIQRNFEISKWWNGIGGLWYGCGLAAIKRQTNDLEAGSSVEDRRQVNIDPGYVSLSKLVLATTKNHAHRIYLSDGIYAEVTLHYRDGAFRGYPWTYPDYASSEYCALFQKVRDLYRRQLRQQAEI